MLKVHSIESFWTQEWPWIRFVLFLQWCFFKCIYCHNPDTIPINWWKEIEIDKIVEMIKQTVPYFWTRGGCTISGGEPLVQAKDLISLFKKLKKENIHTCLDTNWCLWNKNVEELLEYTDMILLDIKHIDNDWHKKITWQENKSVFNFLDYLEKNNKRTRIRYVLVPWYSDQEEYINMLWEKYGKYKCIERLEILPYHTFGEHKWKELWRKYELHWVAAPTEEAVQKAENLFKKHFKEVYVR